MPNIPIDNCTGCTACCSVCPCAAISMYSDGEGFSYPRIESELCVGCGECERVCPVNCPPPISEKFERAAVVQSRDEQVLDECTSGGFLDELCRYVIESLGGYAVGVAYDGEHMPYHRICATYEEAKSLRGSKYAQSELGDVFRDIEILLKDKKTVLFIGTPCQSAGLVSFIGDKHDGKLITADLVCRSIPSRQLWREYLSYMRIKYGSDIKSVACRRKTYGYHSGALEIEFENGRKYKASNRTDLYMKSFHSDVCSRHSCYSCSFKTKHRCTDFTVFDSWEASAVTGGAVKDNDRGYSNVIAHTERAAHILGAMFDIDVYEADAEAMFRYTGGMESENIRRTPERDTFYADIARYGYRRGTEKYISVSPKDRIIEALKPTRYKLLKALKNK